MRRDIVLGDHWQFAQARTRDGQDHTGPVWYDTVVPGEVHEELLARDVIEDPHVSTHRRRRRLGGGE
jgi:hypothetical protein